MSRLLVPAFLLSAVAVPAFATPAHVHPGSCRAYTVGRHDTLYSIARYCRSSVAAVARASHLADARRIAVGQRLHVPGAAPAPRPAPGKDEEEMRGPAQGLTYSFAAGDTLYSLARWSGVSLAALLAANPGIDPQKIELGDPIRLPAGAVPPEHARERERGPACPPHRDHDHDGDRGPMHREHDAGPMHRERDHDVAPMLRDRDRGPMHRDLARPGFDDAPPPPPRRDNDKPDEDDAPDGM